MNRVDELEYRVALLEALLKGVLGTIPTGPDSDGPIYAAIRTFNEANGLPEEVRVARNEVFNQFGMQSVHRPRPR